MQIYKKFHYLPCPLYFFGFAALGPYFFLNLPVLFLPKETLVEDDDVFVLPAIIILFYKYFGGLIF